MGKKYSRRNFLKMTGLSAAAVMTNPSGLFGSTHVENMMQTISSVPSDKVLVLLRLNGGNDALNMIVPTDQFDNLSNHRGRLLPSLSSLSHLDDYDLAFHPRMSGLAELFNEGKMSVVQNVGIENSSRSHFTATDYMTSGNRDQNSGFVGTGWAGRYFQTQNPSFPEGFPNSDYMDPFAIAVGSSVSMTCEGSMANFSHPTLFNAGLSASLSGGDLILDDTYHGNHLQYLQNILNQTNTYNSRINEASELGYANADLYSSDSLSQAFYNIARLITGGIKTKIFVVNLGGFDTHGNQVSATDPTEGRHPNLLARINDALYAFIRDMGSQFDMFGKTYLDRIFGMTFSEFGRQIKQNSSLGTDHGTAGAMLMFGSCFSNQVVGSNPDLSLVFDRSGLPMEIDIRDIYATILRDWFGATESDVLGQFDKSEIIFYDLFTCSGTSGSISELESLVVGEGFNALSVYPIPARDFVNFKGKFGVGEVSIRLYTVSGKRLSSVGFFNQHNDEISFSFPVSTLRPGAYLFRIDSEGIKKSIRFIKK